MSLRRDRNRSRSRDRRYDRNDRQEIDRHHDSNDRHDRERHHDRERIRSTDQRIDRDRHGRSRERHYEREPRVTRDRDGRRDSRDRGTRYKDSIDHRGSKSSNRRKLDNGYEESPFDQNGKDLEGGKEQHQNLEELTEEEQMNRLLGFGGFDSTKGKYVPGKDVGAVNITKKVSSD